MKFDGDTVIPENMETSFLIDEQNKTKLNEFIAESCKKPSSWTWKKQFCVTKGLTELVRDNEMEMFYPPNMI